MGRLFGVPGQGGLLSDRERAAMRTQGLLGFGTSLMQASAPRPGGGMGSFVSDLGTAIQAGQQGAIGGLGLQDALQQHRLAQQAQAARAQFGAGGQLQPTKQQAMDLLAVGVQTGDNALVNAAATLLQQILAAEGRGEDDPTMKTGINPETGQEEYFYLDPKTKEPVFPGVAAAQDRQGLTAYQDLMAGNRVIDFGDRLAGLFEKSKSGGVLRDVIDDIRLPTYSDPTQRTNQIAVLYAFVKAMDRNSAVREGELKLVTEASSMRERAKVMISKIEGGEPVAISAELTSEMQDFMKRRLAQMQERYDETRTNYTKRARRGKVSDDDMDALFPSLPSLPSEGNAAKVQAAIGGRIEHADIYHRPR